MTQPQTGQNRPHVLLRLRNRLLHLIGIRNPDRPVGTNLGMLIQFRDGLLIKLQDIDADQLDAKGKQHYDKVEAILNKARHEITWNAVYQAEMRLASIQTAVRLDLEIQHRLKEIERMLPDKLGSYEDMRKSADNVGDAGDREQHKRALLALILDDLHWSYSRRYYNRNSLLFYTTWTAFVGISLVLSFFYLLWWVEVGTSSEQYDYATFSGYTGLEFVLMAGLVGASFSMLTRKQPNPQRITMEAMQQITSLPFYLLRLIVGGTAAVILYFFFETGIIQTDLVPDLATIGFTQIFETTQHGDTRIQSVGLWVPNADLSKLLIWSFAAGFSEKFVATLLDRIYATTAGDKT